MHNLVRRSTGRLTAVLLTLGLALAACGGAASPSTGTNGGTTPGASAPAAEPGTSIDTGGGGSTEVNVVGSLVSSGIYDATWKWQPGNAADVGVGGITMNSEKGTFANIQVLSDGSIAFNSGAPELTAGSPFRGTGAQVHMKDVQGAQLPCSFTLDNDVTGSDGRVLHLKGDMTITGTVFNC